MNRLIKLLLIHLYTWNLLPKKMAQRVFDAFQLKDV